MAIRVTNETMRQQLEITGQLDFLRHRYYPAILADQIPLSVGGGIGPPRTVMHLRRKACLGEVSVTVWPKRLKTICENKNMCVPDWDPAGAGRDGCSCWQSGRPVIASSNRGCGR